jgi:S1-C subfamily serine protease
VVIRSAAQKARLNIGDRILAVDGKKVEEQVEIEKLLEGKRPGDSVMLEVQPGQSLLPRTKKITIVLGDEPEEQELPQGLL